MSCWVARAFRGSAALTSWCLNSRWRCWQASRKKSSCAARFIAFWRKASALIAIILSGALFGLLHALNPGATLASTAAIAVEAGVLLAAAYLVTRSLWLAIGLHIGWNFTEGGIFGAAVSGGKSHGLITTAFAGPDWLTGGKFGPEASLTAVILCVVVAAVLLAVAIRRGEWKPLRFRFETA